MSSLRHNLEIKARLADLDQARTRLQSLPLQAGGVQLQTDTYFQVHQGRLKLREIAGQPAVLIQYARPDAAAARVSCYYLVPVPEPALLKAALTAALGVRGVVCKRREIHFWHNVRIHLDEVDGLGSFVEFEAVLAAEDQLAAAQESLDQLCRLLALDPVAHLAPSYADLLHL